MPENSSHPKAVWFGIGKQILAFIGGVILAAYVLGQRTGKVNELVTWKDETAPIIKRMDTTGTLSFDLFHKEYERTQARQEKKMEQLEQRIRDMETHKQ